jgi:cell division protein FtsQ
MQRTPEQVTKEAGLTIGQNIFKLDLHAVERRILRDPWVTSASVQRHLPSRITVKVTEHEAAAVVIIGQLPYLATFDGEVFKQVEPGDPSNLVVISGISHEQVARSRHDVEDEVKRAIALAETWKQSGAHRAYPAQEVHIGQLGGLTLYVGTSAIALRMGKAPYRKKVMRAARVLREVRRRRGKAALVFLDNQAHPDRVVVRMR